MFKHSLVVLFISFGLCTSITAQAKSTDTVDDKKLVQEVSAFYKMMIEKHNFTEQELTAWFVDAKPNQGILKTIKRPAEAAMPWYKYRNIFIQQERVDLGLAFWNEHLDTLNRAEKEFGVPPELIVGLIGVETKYGRIKGSIDVFESLYTLGFHFPQRSKFFRKELKEFLILARDQQWTPGMIKGSYAGAMGYGQFMPSSYRMYAVDFDNDGKINLLTNPIDAIGSVANYIKVHKWQKGGEMIYKADVSGAAPKKLLQKSLKPSKKVAVFRKAGVKVDDKLSSEELALLIELKQKDHKEYWLALHNFYVISRYNPRTLYTMAVVQLTEMIKEQYKAVDAGVAK
ncbi:MAG: membrane-bound lytic murein transglycosylase B [Enterobacterales bacterium]